MTRFSPLRYPGGKAKLAPLIAEVISKNDLIGGVYVEPFAGGASVALYLLLNKYVSSICINDKDPAISAFWHVVKYQPEALCNMIASTPVTIDEWKKQLSPDNNDRRMHRFSFDQRCSDHYKTQFGKMYPWSYDSSL